jgi:hypothetical protein
VYETDRKGADMRKTKCMRISAFALLILLIVSSAAACQPTPDQPVIVNKNKDLVEEVKNEHGKELFKIVGKISKTTLTKLLVKLGESQ